MVDKNTGKNDCVPE